MRNCSDKQSVCQSQATRTEEVIMKSGKRSMAMRDEIVRTLLWLRRRYIVSQLCWVSLNVLLIVATTSLSILSVYSIANNTQPDTLWIFITLAIITSCVTFLTNILSIFGLAGKRRAIREQINRLEQWQQRIDSIDETEYSLLLAELARAEGDKG